MWLVYIIAALMTSATVLAIAETLQARQDRWIVRVLTVLLPCAALGLYLWLGNPDVPGAYTQRKDNTRLYTMLAQKPQEDLAKNPADIGALMVLGEINLRLAKDAEAKALYTRALSLAEKTGDARVDVIRRALARVH